MWGEERDQLGETYTRCLKLRDPTNPSTLSYHISCLYHTNFFIITFDPTNTFFRHVEIHKPESQSLFGMGCALCNAALFIKYRQGVFGVATEISIYTLLLSHRDLQK